MDGAALRAFIATKLAGGMNPKTVRNCVVLLGSLFTDLIERDITARNPVRGLPRAVKQLCRPSHDPRTTPFLENRDDIARLADVLPQPIQAMFLVGVMSGLRRGELAALRWSDVSSTPAGNGLPARIRLNVQRQVRNGRVGPPKNGRSRVVPASPGLTRLLADWRREAGGEELVFRPEGRARFVVADRKWRERWKAALTAAGVPSLTFYQATRHTFASHWVLAGQPIEQLSRILGHSSIEITMRNYVHLRPDHVNVPDLFSVGAQEAE